MTAKAFSLVFYGVEKVFSYGQTTGRFLFVCCLESKDLDSGWTEVSGETHSIHQFSPLLATELIVTTLSQKRIIKVGSIQLLMLRVLKRLGMSPHRQTVSSSAPITPGSFPFTSSCSLLLICASGYWFLSQRLDTSQILGNLGKCVWGLRKAELVKLPPDTKIWQTVIMTIWKYRNQIFMLKPGVWHTWIVLSS